MNPFIPSIEVWERESIVSAKRWLDRLIESRTGTRGGSKEKGD